MYARGARARARTRTRSETRTGTGKKTPGEPGHNHTHTGHTGHNRYCTGKRHRGSRDTQDTHGTRGRTVGSLPVAKKRCVGTDLFRRRGSGTGRVVRLEDTGGSRHTQRTHLTSCVSCVCVLCVFPPASTGHTQLPRLPVGFLCVFHGFPGCRYGCKSIRLSSSSSLHRNRNQLSIRYIMLIVKIV